jgi:hypothetical protein
MKTDDNYWDLLRKLKTPEVLAARARIAFRRKRKHDVKVVQGGRQK